MSCPCGGIILADTEDWQVPRCYSCATDKNENVATYLWRCKKCVQKPHKCLCDKPDWLTDKEYVLGDYTFNSSTDFKEEIVQKNYIETEDGYITAKESTL